MNSSEPGAQTVYAYFRTHPDAGVTTRAALARLRILVHERLGLEAEFSLRHDQDKPYLTWLEIYRNIPPADLERALQIIEHAACESGLAALALQARHHEVFTPLSPD